MEGREDDDRGIAEANLGSYSLSSIILSRSSSTETNDVIAGEESMASPTGTSEHPAHHQTAADGTEAAVKARLSTAQKNDLYAALEHLVRVGNYDRHKDWRIKEWERQQSKKMMEEQDGDASKASTVRDVHAQDIRLYEFATHHGLELDPWPKKRKICDHPDNPWDVELGDGINPVQFSRMRLSLYADMPEVRSSEDNRGQSDQNGLNGTFSDLSRSEAPHALILHCWERAVHAAASTTVMVVPQGSPGSLVPLKGVTMTSQQQRTGNRSRDIAQVVCRSLGIVLTPNEFNICPSCGVACITVDQLGDHFFGRNDEKDGRGCCWRQIEDERRKLLARVLQSELNGQIDQLIHLILEGSSEAKRKLDHASKSNNSSRAAFDWQHILRIVEDKLRKSRKVRLSGAAEKIDRENESHMQDTLEVEGGKSPLIINQALLQAVRNRLIERYAKVPR
jgi:hypothetical protein